MQYLKFFKELNKNSVNMAGGKGASLGEMINSGIPVPDGFVVLASAFDKFLVETQLKEEIEARLKEVNLEDVNLVNKTSETIRDAIHDRPMPMELQTDILKQFDKLGADYVAVRSSATAEDSAIASWAGELESYLNTTRDNVVDRVKECWSSLFTPRAIFYRHEKNLIDHYVSVAVVVQKMVQSKISGISFTVHPVTQDYNQMIIEAVFGLGEAIVGGLVTPDSYVIDKKEMSILDINIGEQTRQLVRTVEEKNKKIVEDEYRGNGWVKLGPEGAKQKLSGKEVLAVAEVCKKIEDHYGFPCDIEWAMDKKHDIYITQSRPITTLLKS